MKTASTLEAKAFTWTTSCLVSLSLMAACGVEGEVGTDPTFEGVSEAEPLELLDRGDVVFDDTPEGDREALSLPRCVSDRDSQFGSFYTLPVCRRLKELKQIKPPYELDSGGKLYYYSGWYRDFDQSRYANGYRWKARHPWKHYTTMIFSSPMKAYSTTCHRPRCRL